MSIEAFVSVNFMMNLLILGISLRAMGHIPWKRVFMASLVGTGYAVLACALGWSWLRSIGMQTACMAAMAMTALGRRYRRSWKGCIYIGGSAAFTGGVLLFLRRWFSPGGVLLPTAGLLCVAAAVLLNNGLKPDGASRDHVRLRISTRMGSTVVDALVDTGNRLREPVSGLPVLIVGHRLLENVLDFTRLHASRGRLLPGFRPVHYGGLGGEGEMLCFRPASVCIWQDGRWLEAPDMWIAIYQGELPSELDALAPPVFV